MDNIFRLTLDLESNHDLPNAAYFRVMNDLLSHLENVNIRATFFVNGSAISSITSRSIVKEISELGHEIGSHGHAHSSLESLGPKGLRSDLLISTSALTELTQKPIIGFRAPYFSLTKKTPWAPEEILSAGFLYSSSTIPALNPQSGFPGLPRVPFRWNCGLLEFPVPVWGLGRFSLPVLGGGYLRVFPKVLMSLVRRQLLRRGYPWTYLHPYDLTEDIPVHSPNESVGLKSWILKLNRHNSMSRYMSLLDSTSSSMGDLATNLATRTLQIVRVT